MAGAYLALLLLKSALTHRMRTVTVTVVQEVWLKGSYLALAVVYLQGWMPFDTFFRWFLYTYAAAVAMLLLEAWSVKLRPAQPQFRKDIKPFLEYGLYALWNDGSRVIAKNLDVVMVGALLGLAVVPKYTFAFFIATVVALPLRAMTPILRALTSKAVSELGPEQSQGELQQAARVQLIATSTLLTAIWAGMPALDLALPEAYRGLQWGGSRCGVVLCGPIGWRHGGGHPAILQPVPMGHARQFGIRVDDGGDQPLLHQGLNMGVEGAALATALTALLNFMSPHHLDVASLPDPSFLGWLVGGCRPGGHGGPGCVVLVRPHRGVGLGQGLERCPCCCSWRVGRRFGPRHELGLGRLARTDH